MSVVSKKLSSSLYSMLVLLLLCLVTAFSSGCGNKASTRPGQAGNSHHLARLRQPDQFPI